MGWPFTTVLHEPWHQITGRRHLSWLVSSMVKFLKQWRLQCYNSEWVQKDENHKKSSLLIRWHRKTVAVALYPVIFILTLFYWGVFVSNSGCCWHCLTLLPVAIFHFIQVLRAVFIHSTIYLVGSGKCNVFWMFREARNGPSRERHGGLARAWFFRLGRPQRKNEMGGS